MKASELRNKSEEELKTELSERLHEQFKYRIQSSTGQLAQTHLLKKNRREIARINTVINEITGG